MEQALACESWLHFLMSIRPQILWHMLSHLSNALGYSSQMQRQEVIHKNNNSTRDIKSDRSNETNVHLGYQEKVVLQQKTALSLAYPSMLSNLMGAVLQL